MILTEATKTQLTKKLTSSQKETALTISYKACGCVGMQLSIGIQKIKERGAPQIKENVDGYIIVYDVAAREILKDATIDFNPHIFNYGFHLVD